MSTLSQKGSTLFAASNKCLDHLHKIGQTMADPPAINSKVKKKKKKQYKFTRVN